MSRRLYRGTTLLALSGLLALTSCQGTRVSASVGMSYGRAFGPSWYYGPTWGGPVIVTRPPAMWRPRPVPPRPMPPRPPPRPPVR
jgi:hypothetical protein